MLGSARAQAAGRLAGPVGRQGEDQVLLCESNSIIQSLLYICSLDWGLILDAGFSILQEQWAFAQTLEKSLNSIRAILMHHCLAFERDQVPFHLLCRPISNSFNSGLILCLVFLYSGHL
jgi:hypothetical protein